MKRTVYFEKDNILYCKTVECKWSSEDIGWSISNAREEICKSIPSEFRPAIDVSTYSFYNYARDLYIGESSIEVSRRWLYSTRENKEDYINSGLLEDGFINGLNEDKLMWILSVKSFYDMQYNGTNKIINVPICLVAIQLLYKQNKLDYLGDLNKFMHWFIINCGKPIEYFRGSDLH